MENTLFKLSQIEADKSALLYQADIDPTHPVFEGHFPEKAVVPGVFTMNMIKKCVEDAMSKKLTYNYIRECKFLLPILPTEHSTLAVKIDLKPTEAAMNIVALVTSGDSKMLKLKATLA